MDPDLNGRPDQSGSAAGPFRRVLVAWDGSPDSVAALAAAAALVSGSRGHVVALTVLPERAHVEAGEGLGGAEPGDPDRVRENFARARAALQRTSQARIDLHTAAGRQVARSLCGYATEHGFDLLVLGRHGDGGVLHPRLGRVAEAAVRDAEVPVLLISGR
ncbi:MAG TPA: universal stress protein [Streptosporangiaceae bacterium]|nr:universal stress protein [Streptosporangiaceae bacterium]